MMVAVEMRYASVAACAVALLGLDWWPRLYNPNYARMLQGTAIAVLSLSVFAAMRVHTLLDPGAALGLLVLVTLFSATLAVKQNALGLPLALWSRWCRNAHKTVTNKCCVVGCSIPVQSTRRCPS
jgi:uncharacterized membrane protein